jgi:hypothetical protein
MLLFQFNLKWSYYVTVLHKIFTTFTAYNRVTLFHFNDHIFPTAIIILNSSADIKSTARVPINRSEAVEAFYIQHFRCAILKYN